MGEIRNTYRILDGKPEVKRQLGRPRRRWEDKFKVEVKEIGSEGVDCIHLAQDRILWRVVLYTVMNFLVP
jgi:hypothetical protein